MDELEAERRDYYKARRLAQEVYKEAARPALEVLRLAKVAYDKAIESAEEVWYRAEEVHNKTMMDTVEENQEG